MSVSSGSMTCTPPFLSWPSLCGLSGNPNGAFMLRRGLGEWGEVYNFFGIGLPFAA